MDLRYYQWIIAANRDSICNETGNPIKIGDTILYRPAIKGNNIPAQVYCKDSKAYKESLNDIRTGSKIQL